MNLRKLDELDALHERVYALEESEKKRELKQISLLYVCTAFAFGILLLYRKGLPNN